MNPRSVQNESSFGFGEVNDSGIHISVPRKGLNNHNGTATISDDYDKGKLKVFLCHPKNSSCSRRIGERVHVVVNIGNGFTTAQACFTYHKGWHEGINQDAMTKDGSRLKILLSLDNNVLFLLSRIE